jgi:hypothetical protein
MPAHALDLSSVGTYAIVHSDGHATDKPTPIRLVRLKERQVGP